MNDDVSIPATSFDVDTFTISNLPAGNYTLTIYNAQSTNYNASQAIVNFTVDKYTPVINVTVSDVVYGEEVIFKVQSDVSGKYNVSVGDISKEVETTAGEINDVTFNDLAAYDSYEVVVSYNETQNYTVSLNNTEKVKVAKAASSVSIETTNGTFMTVNATVVPTIVNQTTATFNITNGEFEVTGNLDELNTTLATLAAAFSASFSAFTSVWAFATIAVSMQMQIKRIFFIVR